MADYITGSVDIAVGATALTGNSTVWVTGMTGRKIYIHAAKEVYDFTYVSALSGTIDRAYVASAAASSSNYTMYKRRYQLASDFWRPVNNGPERGAFYRFENGVRVDLIPKWSEEWGEYDFYQPGIPSYYHIIYTGGVYYVEISPPDTDIRTIFYDYIPYFAPMTEYTTGTVAVTNNSANVTGTGTSFALNCAVGDWFRIDVDGTGSSSVWYKILTITDATHIVLSSVYTGTTNTSRAYTISEEPSLPPVFHPLIIHKSAVDRAIDRDAKSMQAQILLLERYLGRVKQSDEGYNWNTEVQSIYRKYNYRR